MRLTAALPFLALLALAPLSAPAADAPADALSAAVRDAGQLRVLRAHGLSAPPNLLAFGLTLDADGVYRAARPPEGAPPGTPRRTATPGQLAAALARVMLAPRAAAPPAASPLARHADLARAADRRLSDTAAALSAPARFDAGFAPSPSGLPPARAEALRRSLLRHGYERLADGAGLSGAGAPPEAGAPSAWSGLDRGQVSDRLIELGHGSDAGIAARKGELVRLAVSGGGEERIRALQLLGRLRDDSLLPVLLPALKNAKGFEDRRGAADALGALAAGYKAREGGWSSFVERAPPILNVMLKASPDWNFRSETLRGMFMGLDLINLMEPADQKRFLAGFDDPRVLLMMLSLGDTRRIERDAGVHSGSAALIYARYRELAGAGATGLGAFLADPAVSPATRALLLDRLNRYRLIGPELERDETFRRELPRLLFERRSRVWSTTVFSIGVLAAGLPKAEFARHAADYIRSATAEDARAAVAFFLLHPQMLSPEQRREVESRAGGLDAEVRAALAAHRAAPPMYERWPKGAPLEAALVFTQAGHAQAFFKTLAGLGYRAARGPGGTTIFTRREAGREVRLTAAVFPSDKEGWAQDRAAVGRAVLERLRDPRWQVVVYRGHVGDYGKLSPDPAIFAKAFIDLSCDSDAEAAGVLGQCRDCAFFGTNQTSEGSVNNAFLPQVLSALAARESFAGMSRRFERSMPRLFSRYTGTWSPALLWEAASERGR